MAGSHGDPEGAETIAAKSAFATQEQLNGAQTH